MKKFNVSLKIENTFRASIKAKDEDTAKILLKQRFSKVEVADSLHNMNVNILEINEEAQMSFNFESTRQLTFPDMPNRL